MILGPLMSKQSTTPNLVERVVAFFEAANRRDLDARMSFLAPEAVWDRAPRSSPHAGSWWKPDGSVKDRQRTCSARQPCFRCPRSAGVYRDLTGRDRQLLAPRNEGVRGSSRALALPTHRPKGTWVTDGGYEPLSRSVVARSRSCAGPLRRPALFRDTCDDHRDKLSGDRGPRRWCNERRCGGG